MCRPNLSLNGTETGWEPLSPDLPDYHDVLESAPCLVMEVPFPVEKSLSESVECPESKKKKAKKKKDDADLGWSHIFSVYVIFPGVFQAYTAKQLKTVNHYQCSQEDVPTLVQLAAKTNQSRCSSRKLKLHLIKGDVNYKDEFLCVRNDLAPSHFRGLKFRELMKKVSTTKQEQSRNHRRVDIGATGNNNSPRTDPLSQGLSKPACHVATNEPWAKDYLVALSDAIRRVFPNDWNLFYHDEARMREFAWKYTSCCRSFVEAAALIGQLLRSCGFTLAHHHLSGHTDNHNDDSDPNFEIVIGLSVLYYNQEHDALIRAAHVTYGKKAAADYMARKRLFGPILDMIVKAHNSFPPSQKFVSTELMPTKDDRHGKTLPAPHSMKTVYYSVLAHPVETLVRTYPAMQRNGWFLFAALFPMIVSNCPQIHYYTVMELCRNPSLLGCHIEELCPFDFAWCLYNYLWDVKDGNIPTDYKLTQRYQPSHNIRASREQVINSMRALARVAFFLNRIPIQELTEQLPYYRSRAAAHLSSSCPNELVDLWDLETRFGVVSCGTLIAQHYLAVMALLGVVPLAVLSGAEISIGTATWKCLRSFGLSDSCHAEQSATLLNAVASLLDVSLMQAEEIICKSTQCHRGTHGQKKDWIPPACPLSFVSTSNKVMKLHCDGECKAFLPLNVDMSEPFSEAPRLSGTFWKFDRNPALLRRKSSSSSRKALDLSKYFPLIIPKQATIHGESQRNNCKLPIPQYVTVLLSVPKSHELSKFNPDVLMRDLCKLGADCSDRKVWASSAVVVSVAGFPSLVKEPADGSIPLKLSKKARKRKFQEESHTQPVSVPPGVYHCRGVIIPASSNRDEFTFWAPSSFCLWDNSPRETKSFIFDGRRYFSSKVEAKSHCCLAALMHLPLRSASVCSKLLAVSVDESFPKEVSDEWYIPGTEPPLKYRNDGFAVGIKVISCAGDRRNHFPFLVGVRYSGGGVGYYLTDDFGCCTSGVHLLPPPPIALRLVRGIEVPTEYVGVLAHSKINRKWKLLILWKDGSSTWEPRGAFTKAAEWPVYYYAERHGLLGKSGWKHLAKAGKKRLPPLFVQGCIDEV